MRWCSAGAHDRLVKEEDFDLTLGARFGDVSSQYHRAPAVVRAMFNTIMNIGQSNKPGTRRNNFPEVEELPNKV